MVTREDFRVGNNKGVFYTGMDNRKQARIFMGSLRFNASHITHVLARERVRDGRLTQAMC